jgi:hypothetical protein
MSNQKRGKQMNYRPYTKEMKQENDQLLEGVELENCCEECEKFLEQFLDALVEDGINNPDSLVIFTEEMAKEMDEKLRDVIVD